MTSIMYFHSEAKRRIRGKFAMAWLPSPHKTLSCFIIIIIIVIIIFREIFQVKGLSIQSFKTFWFEEFKYKSTHIIHLHIC